MRSGATAGRSEDIVMTAPDGGYSARLATPFAVIGIRTRADRLVRVDYLPLDSPRHPPRDALAREVCRQIGAYLADPLHRFDIPYALEGTTHQLRVWAEIARIPVRETRSYGDLARAVGSSPRAVGGACGSNPVPLVIACHRVLAADGRLGGFMHSRSGFALDIKSWLLAHERAGAS